MTEPIALAIDTRQVTQRQQFVIRVFAHGHHWWDFRAPDAAAALKANDAAIAAKEAGLIRSYAVYAQWLEVEAEDPQEITKQWRLTER